MKLSNNKRFKRIEDFLLRENFSGFTKNDLFIISFIKKAWGQDIATLSNMAESLVNISIADKENVDYYIGLLDSVIKIAIHKNVSPYRSNIFEVENLGKFGYYLEHLNIILGSYAYLSKSLKYYNLNTKISYHLLSNSNLYSNYHADLLPNVNMKWTADQAAIIYSIWLYDKNYKTDLHFDLSRNWFNYLDSRSQHKLTGLYKTEVLGTRKYSSQPRGCSIAYMIHYMSKFDNIKAKSQWFLYKKYMMKKFMGRAAFREFLPSYKGKWSPDSGPIIAGCGVASTGLALNASTSIDDYKTYYSLLKTMNPVGNTFSMADSFIGSNILTRIGTDLLSSSIWLNAETKQRWFK